MQQYNRHSVNKIYPLSQRGFRQAERNNSHQIWTLLSWSEETQSSIPVQDEHQEERTFEAKTQEVTNMVSDEGDINNNSQAKKTVSFKLSKNDDSSNSNKKLEEINHSNDKRKSKSILISTNKEPVAEPEPQTELQRLKRKSIEKYIKDQVPFTRTLSNSAFRKFYQRPCPEAYGRTNVKSGGVCYGDFMKTHNIQPHTLDNKPEAYQTYTSALNFGKRTKLDLQDRWTRIERQLAKNLDTRELAKMKAIGEIEMNGEDKDKILKENINKYGEKKGSLYPEAVRQELSKTSKSLDKMTTKGTFKTQDLDSTRKQKQRSKSSEKPLYYIYKYQEKQEDGYNCTRYARDRHGITCYVDNCFRENDEAYLNFQKKIKPIYADKCKPEDVNIDAIRIQNSKQSKQQEYPRHYLTPNVEIPYMPNKYSRKKSASICETTA